MALSRCTSSRQAVDVDGQHDCAALSPLGDRRPVGEISRGRRPPGPRPRGGIRQASVCPGSAATLPDRRHLGGTDARAAARLSGSRRLPRFRVGTHARYPGASWPARGHGGDLHIGSWRDARQIRPVWKSSMYEDSVRVPLIVSGPGFATGARVDTPVSLLDVQATLFRATGATRPDAWWGSPLQDIMVGDTNRVVLSEYHGHGTRSGTFMIRKGRWKLLYHAAAPHQLFDVIRDPDELCNRYDDEPAVAQDLERELRQRCDPEREFQRAHDVERAQQARLDEISA